MFMLLYNIFILCQINIIIWVDRLGHVKCVKFNTNFLTVYSVGKIKIVDARLSGVQHFGIAFQNFYACII